MSVNIIYTPQNNKPILIIDTSGKINSIEQTQAQVLMTKTKIYVRDDENPQQVKVYDMSKYNNMSFDRESVQSAVNKIAPFFIIVLYAVTVIASYFYRLIQAMIYGALGMIFNAMFRAKLYYQQVLRLAIIALTPAVIIATVLQFFAVTYPYQLFSYFVISMFYLMYVVICNRVRK